MKSIRVAISAALVAAVVSLQPASALAQRDYRNDRHDRYDDRQDRKDDQRDRKDARRDYQEWRNYDYRHVEPGQRRYDAARYYRNDSRRYPVQRMSRNDRIYRGTDNRYYCRRDDGTTGLIIGGVAGGILGNVIAPGESKILGTVLGAGLGAVIGREIDRGDITCR